MKQREKCSGRGCESPQVHHKDCMNEQDVLKELQKNLAKDLAHLEANESLSEQQLDKITDTYSKVYDIVTKIKSL